MAKANKAYKYRIYPNEQQRILFAKTFGCVRFVYNQILKEQESRFHGNQKRMSAYEANNFCNHILKGSYPWLREVDKFALNNSIFALNFAYKRFFETKGICRHPKYKSKHGSKASYTTNMTNNNIYIGENFIKLPKAGKVKAKINYLLPKNVVIKTATVNRTPNNKYFCSICYEYQAIAVSPVIPVFKTTLGLDYSSHDFYVDSNVDRADYPRYYSRAGR